MRVALFVVAALLCVSVVAGFHGLTFEKTQIGFKRNSHVSIIDRLNQDKCGLCVSLMQTSLKQLVNLFLQESIGSCGAICGQLSTKGEAMVCELVCEAAGLELFSKFMDKHIDKWSDDEIYFCEKLKQCPFSDGGSVKIDSVDVSPKSGPVGTTFTITADFTVFNQTSTGIVGLGIHGGDEPLLGVGDDELDEGYAPGKYSVKWNLKSQDDTQDFPPVVWGGNYTARVVVCDNMCDNLVPHSGLLAEGQHNFTVQAAP